LQWLLIDTFLVSSCFLVDGHIHRHLPKLAETDVRLKVGAACRRG